MQLFSLHKHTKAVNITQNATKLLTIQKSRDNIEVSTGSEDDVGNRGEGQYTSAVVTV